MALGLSEARRLAVRSLFLQVLLNYRTMQGAGYLFTLWPWLRQGGQSKERVNASAEYLNAHPVLAALAIGAMRRRIEDGAIEQDPLEFARWQNSLCGPLGVVGDTLIWDRWKPLLFSLGVLALLWSTSLAVWGAVAVSLLLVYNLPLFFLRTWAIRRGYELGPRVLEILGSPIFLKSRTILSFAGVIAAGLLLAEGLVTAGVLHDGRMSLFHSAQFTAAFAVMLTGVRRYWNLSITLLMALLVALAFPFFLGSFIH
jgi:mannose/fructose/N-acetylgalactosamine-specific phosphotransferase system component IID